MIAALHQAAWIGDILRTGMRLGDTGNERIRRDRDRIPHWTEYLRAAR